ncbi:MAG TPA: iron dicitrate transport regulator FecR, partial [Runella sp.]|nr:iron dicitrate transport regulator FecR [Runella sp.]
MNIEITKEIIFNYLSGRASALQKQMIDDWVKKPENEELFYKWLVEYEYQNPQYSANITAGLERFTQLANQVDENPDWSILSEPEETEINYFSWRWWAIAASIMGVLVTGWLYQDTLLYRTHRTDFGETQTITLSDGTQVTLNANSSLEVPRFGFGQKTRQVKLTGEANFSVTHTIDNQRFVVKTEKGVDVVVLGTEFSVYARRKEAKVVLNKGKVQLRYQEGKAQKELMMKPGEL